MVTSYAEVWIEIEEERQSRESGGVTSYAEVWIEISVVHNNRRRKHVTSYAEVWIEIAVYYLRWCPVLSPPTRRCGLK